MTEQEMKKEVQLFARMYPSYNTMRLLSLCSSGVISWADGYRVAVRAMEAGNKAAEEMISDKENNR